jgi:thiol-disulfide isomerase/thioredoxin
MNISPLRTICARWILRSTWGLLLLTTWFDPGHAQSAAANPAGLDERSAIEQMLRLFELRQSDTAAALGARLAADHPDHPAINALHVIASRRHGDIDEALALAERNAKRWPDDSWTQAALAVVLGAGGRWGGRLADAAAALERARQLAPDDPHILTELAPVYGGLERWTEFVAIVDRFIEEGLATADLRVRRANHMRGLANRAQPRDTALYRAGTEGYAAVRADWPLSPVGYLQEGEFLLNQGRVEEALPLLEHAVRLTPHASGIASLYWRALRDREGIGPAETERLVGAAVQNHLEARDYAPGALLAAARFYANAEGLALADRVIREHPGSWEATALTRAPGDFLGARVADPTADTEELWALYQEAARRQKPEEYFFAAFKLLPEVLAERGDRLVEAEELVLKGLEFEERALEDRVASLTVAQFAEAQSWVRSEYIRILGQIRLSAGDLPGARQAFRRSHEAHPGGPPSAYGLGQVAEREGDLEQAEYWYAVGFGLEQSTFDFRKNREAMERLYAQRTGSAEGLEEYIAGILERERARQKERMIAERIQNPQLLPAFDLAWLDYRGRFDSEDLKGKVAVINFWGVWCPPCVQEAPAIQRFSEAVRDHPEVVFLTVSNDVNPRATLSWMRDRGYDFPVLIEENLAERVGVSVYPSTLFLDREGRVVYRVVGESALANEEYAWRVEALLNESVER